MPTPTAVIRLNADALAAWAAAEGLSGDTAVAERIGFNQTTVRRVRVGEIRPGEEFIAALLKASGKRFEEFFQLAEVA